MSEGYKIRSLSEIVNEILSTVRSYYDAEYAYYIEKDRGDIETIYEWCDENIEWQRDRKKHAIIPSRRIGNLCFHPFRLTLFRLSESDGEAAPST